MKRKNWTNTDAQGLSAAHNTGRPLIGSGLLYARLAREIRGTLPDIHLIGPARSFTQCRQPHAERGGRVRQIGLRMTTRNKKHASLEPRKAEYRTGRPAPDLRGKTVILVDDCLATGATMQAAVMALKQRQVARCVVGVPVSSPETCAEFRAEVDEIVCAITPEEFRAVGQFYEDFSQTTEKEVRELLASVDGGDVGP